MDQQDKVDFNKNRADRAKYANNYGENLASYTDMALAINGHDGGLASTNSHAGNNSSYVQSNNHAFVRLDKSKGDNRLTERQQANKTKELAQCKGALCRQATEAKYGVVSAAQGAAEVTGMAYGAAKKVATDVADLAKLLSDPEKAQAAAEKLNAAINRLDELIQNGQITRKEKAEVEQVLSGIVQHTVATATDASQLDGPGLSASFGEGKKTGAAIAAVVGVGKLNRILKKLKVARGAKALGPLKKLSGTTDEAARLARNQPYGAKVGDVVKNHSAPLIRKTLPPLPEKFANEFEGPVRIRTFKAGEEIHRSPWTPRETKTEPGSWFGTRKTLTVKGTNSQYQINKWGNPSEVMRTYKFKRDVTVYYGKVKGGTGYQALFPADVNPSSVLKYVDEVPLK